MMDWVDLTWPMLAAASLVLGLIHAMVWLGQPRQRIHLALAIAAGSVGALVLLELDAFHATTPERMAVSMRWMHVAVATMVLSLLYVVHTWFGFGSARLALGVAVLRLLGLLVNFAGGQTSDWTGWVEFRPPPEEVVTGVKESWKLTCRDRDGRLLARHEVVVDRGETAHVRRACAEAKH